MSGIIGHTAYALLAAKAATERQLPVAPVILRHLPSYLAGAYLGCDIQTVPSAICVDTGEGVGHGPAAVERSPITGGEVRPWSLDFEGKSYTSRQLHQKFYGRSHLILGWPKEGAASLRIPLSDLVSYAADVTGDTLELFDPDERVLAYVLGWLTHVTGDGLIKAVLQGINLNLIDGQYTARNRPVQDLVTFHEIGIQEWGLDWSALLDDLAGTPVEPVQLHYMRCAEPQGRLGSHFPNGWTPSSGPLLKALLLENRRYQRVRNPRLVEQLKLVDGECDPALSQQAGGLRYQEMREVAEAAKFREALWEIGEITADFFEKVIEEQDRLHDLPASGEPDWDAGLERWRA